jgi:hypothetical protein
MSDQPFAEAALQHTTNTREENPRSQRDSNPQSQESSARKLRLIRQSHRLTVIYFVFYITDKTECSIMAMFIEMAGSRIRKITVAVELLIGVMGVIYIQPREETYTKNKVWS